MIGGWGGWGGGESQRTHKGLTKDSQRTQQQTCRHVTNVATHYATHKGLTKDSQRTHKGFTKDSQWIHRGLTKDLQLCIVLYRQCNGSTIYGKNFIALYKTIHKIEKLEK